MIHARVEPVPLRLTLLVALTAVGDSESFGGFGPGLLAALSTAGVADCVRRAEHVRFRGFHLAVSSGWMEPARAALGEET